MQAIRITVKSFSLIHLSITQPNHPFPLPCHPWCVKCSANQLSRSLLAQPVSSAGPCRLVYSGISARNTYLSEHNYSQLKYHETGFISSIRNHSSAAFKIFQKQPANRTQTSSLSGLKEPKKTSFCRSAGALVRRYMYASRRTCVQYAYGSPADPQVHLCAVICEPAGVSDRGSDPNWKCESARSWFRLWYIYYNIYSVTLTVTISTRTKVDKNSSSTWISKHIQGYYTTYRFLLRLFKDF